MVEIVLLFFLTKYMGALARKKGLPPLRWKLQTIAAWIVAEFAGVFAGMMIFGRDNYSWVFTGFAAAFGAYFYLRNRLQNYPDQLSEDDINNIGRE